MFNQRDICVFSFEKSMIFPFVTAPSEIMLPPSPVKNEDSLLNHLIAESEALQALGSQTLTSVRPGQLILHTLSRPISQSASMQVCAMSSLLYALQTA